MAQGVTVRRSLLISIGDANIDQKLIMLSDSTGDRPLHPPIVLLSGSE